MSGSGSRLDSISDIYAGRQLFDLSQANRSLVLVGRIMHDVVSHYRSVLDYQEALERAQAEKNARQVESAKWNLGDRIHKLQRCADELLELGVELKDWEQGLVDFPARVAGREISLCWMHGESEIAYWHEGGANCSVRRSLSELLAPARSA